MCVKIVVSRMLMLRCLWLTLGLCIWLGAAPAGAVPTMEWDGNLTATGGVNVGSSSDAGTGQVKAKVTTSSSSTTPPTAVWHSIYQPGPSGSAGPNLGGTTADPSSVWTNDNNVLTTDYEYYAYTTDCSGTGYLKVTNFGFSLPTDATVRGIEVTFRQKATTTYPKANYQLINGESTIGNGKSTSLITSWSIYPTLGGSSDLWGASSISRDTVNGSSFGVRIWMTDADGETFCVDYVRIKVYYSPMEGTWMAGSFLTDGSWRLVKNVTNLGANVKLGINSSGNLGIGTTGHATYPLYMAGGAYCTGTTWTNSSSRSQKLNIAPVPAASAWELLDLLQPVDFEYRKMETQFKLKDGSVVREMPADPNEVAEEVTVWTDEGSGECHRGFIAEDVPAPLTRGDGIAALDIAANNTAALKEAKRRIMELERQMAALTPAGSGAAAVGAAGSGAAAVGAAGSGASGVSDLSDASDLSDKTLQRLTESVLKKIGVDPWVEVSLAEAWEEVDETAPVSAPQTVTRYRANLDTMQVETYTVEETVTQQQPTGRKVRQLKGDVRFDEKTGKFYRWCGLGGATPQQTSAALLGKLLPGLVAVSSGRAGNAAVSFPSSLKPQASSLFSHSWNTGRVRP